MKQSDTQHCVFRSLKTLTFIFFLFVWTSCSDDEKQPEKPFNLKYGVSFKIKSKIESGTRSTPPDTDKIENIQVVAFEKDETGKASFYQLFNTIEYQESYLFDMLKEGTFQLYFIANVDSKLTKDIKSATTPEELKNLLIEEDPDPKNELFLMNSGNKQIQVETQLNEIVKPTTEVISLKRLVACFDFYNKIKDFTPTKILFKNRITKSLFINESTANEAIQKEGMETKEFGVTSTEPLFSSLYSYENLFTDLESKISFEIYGKINSQEVSKEIILQNETSPEDFLVKRNHKYSITLNPGDIIVKVEDQEYKFEFGLDVDDWADEEIINN